MSKKPESDENMFSLKMKRRLNEIIFDSDMTKTEFAKKAGLGKETLSYATVYGIVPSVPTLIKIADFAERSIPYILGETDDESFYPSVKNETFHTRLAALAEENNVKFSQISAKTSFAKNSIYEWNRRKCLPTLGYLYELADYFGVSVDYLLGRTDYKN